MIYNAAIQCKYSTEVHNLYKPIRHTYTLPLSTTLFLSTSFLQHQMVNKVYFPLNPFHTKTFLYHESFFLFKILVLKASASNETLEQKHTYQIKIFISGPGLLHFAIPSSDPKYTEQWTDIDSCVGGPLVDINWPFAPCTFSVAYSETKNLLRHFLI